MKIHPRPGSAEKNSEKEEGKPMKGEAIFSWLHQDADPQKPLVVMMCGVAGAGKTTLAKQLEAEGYLLLSIDEEVWRQYGRYGVDYPPSAYAAYSAAVEAQLQDQLVKAIQEHRPVVIDFSFWSRKKRDAYRQRIAAAGGQARLLYLKASSECLRRRLRLRAQRRDANAAFEITGDILNGYLQDFEAPQGEGELVIDQDQSADFPCA